VVTVGHKERGARQPWRLDEAVARSGARARRGAKAARAEAFPHEGGGNRAKRH
jgi:hypothetical protein